jgi:hypothetical protein
MRRAHTLILRTSLWAITMHTDDTRPRRSDESLAHNEERSYVQSSRK